MIEKERLEELIEQGTIVYEVVYSYNRDKVCEYDLKNIPTYDKTHLEHFYDMHNIFETLEEAEWHKEFGCIEKPQYLKFPKWNQIEKSIEYMRKFGLNHNDKVLARIITSDSIYYFKLCKDLEVFTFQLKQTYIGDDLCEQIRDKFPISLGKATKENYTIACRKAKELFLGENNG